MNITDLISRFLAWRKPVVVPVKPPPPVVPREPVWLTKARTYIGFHERPGNLGIEEFIALGHCGSLGSPWCAVFVNGMLESSGFRGSRSALARSFERDENSIQLAGPALGCIVTMWRTSKASGQGHVFFYLGENENGILALGGNQNDQVCKQYEPPQRVVGFWWPKTAPLPTVGKIAVHDEHAGEGSET